MHGKSEKAEKTAGMQWMSSCGLNCCVIGFPKETKIGNLKCVVFFSLNVARKATLFAARLTDLKRLFFILCLDRSFGLKKNKKQVIKAGLRLNV